MFSDSVRKRRKNNGGVQMKTTITTEKILRLFVVALLVSLAGCGGGGGGGAEAGRAPANQLSDASNDAIESSDEGKTEPPSDAQNPTQRALAQHFAEQVQPQLDFCRSCHVPGGLANVDNGRNLMLSQDKQQDFVNFKASWERLGKNNPVSRILTMASGQTSPHTGGAPWPVASAPYKNVQILFGCFENPANCGNLLSGAAEVENTLPLLGSSHARSYMSSFCEDKPDSAALPQDPRELIRPGVNQGKAVVFNAYWEDCTTASNNAWTKPKTCGEYRSRRDAGE
ncbi:MAG TPA: hypothetical protein VFM46_06170, partial [Pseudomonadales bacterium]|nr:hypothetical protein [Pseudomonadales bacterium]